MSVSRHRAWALLWVALACVPAVVSAVLLLRFTPDVPVHDTYQLMYPSIHLRHGTFLLRELAVRHAGHVLLVPASLTFLLMETGLWSPMAHAFIAWFLNCAACLLLARIVVSSCASLSSASRSALICAMCWLLFFWNDFLHQSLTLGAPFVSCCFFGAVLALMRGGPRRVVIAVALCFAAGFSFGHGLLTWVALLPLLAHRGKGVKITWVLSALSAFALYAVRMHGDAVPHPPQGILEDAWYLLRLFSVPWAPFSAHEPPLAGAACVAAGVFLCIRTRHMAYARPLQAIMLFGLLAAVMIMLKRGGMGQERALSVWYPSIVGFGCIGVLSLAWLAYDAVWTRVATLALVLVVWSNGDDAIWRWAVRAAQREAGRACLVSDPQHAPDACLMHVHDNVSFIRGMPPYLRAWGLMR